MGPVTPPDPWRLWHRTHRVAAGVTKTKPGNHRRPTPACRRTFSPSSCSARKGLPYTAGDHGPLLPAWKGLRKGKSPHLGLRPGAGPGVCAGPGGWLSTLPSQRISFPLCVSSDQPSQTGVGCWDQGMETGQIQVPEGPWAGERDWPGRERSDGQSLQGGKHSGQGA